MKRLSIVFPLFLTASILAGGDPTKNVYGQAGHKIIPCELDVAFRDGIGRERDCFRGKIAYALVDERPGLSEGLLDVMRTVDAKKFADELVQWCNGAHVTDVFGYRRGRGPAAHSASGALGIALAAWVSATDDRGFGLNDDWRPIATRKLDQIAELQSTTPKESRIVAYAQLARALMYPVSQERCDALRTVSNKWRTHAPHIALRALEHLGDTLDTMGREATAKAVYREIVESYPSFSKWQGYMDSVAKAGM